MPEAAQLFRKNPKCRMCGQLRYNAILKFPYHPFNSIKYRKVQIDMTFVQVHPPAAPRQDAGSVCHARVRRVPCRLALT